jgi:hypothetical protein
MIRYLTAYPLSILIVIIICYLSFFQPPQTSLDEVPYIDKLAHICMYGGLTTVLWIEYLFHQSTFNYKTFLAGSICFPICLSGIIEILQSQCTDNRSGDWFDLLANATGVCIACLLGSYVWKPLYQKFKSSGSQKR